MTAKQKREHKAGNKLRRHNILKLARTGSKAERSYFGGMKVGK
jgi:hypothetical protein